MATLSPKYIAGFFDADGSVTVIYRKNANDVRAGLLVSFSQATEQDEVLHLIHKEWGGSLVYQVKKDRSYTMLSIGGNKQCAMLLNRIKQFLVIKRHYVEVCLDLITRRLSPEEVERTKAYLKAHRQQKSLPLPKHPTRGWLAGYLDGDGCISVQTIHAPTGNATMVLHIAASNYDTEGLEIIQKQFGGTMHDMCDGRVKQWKVTMPASKAKEIFEPIVEHMVVKRDQVQLLLKCAAMGHFRDGNNIKAALKHLKAHPHRLSEPKPDLGKLYQTIRNLPPNLRGGQVVNAKKLAMRQSDAISPLETRT